MLAITFLRHQATKPVDAPDLEPRLAAMVDRARMAYPELAVPTDAYVQFVAERVAIEHAEAHAEDLFLACATALAIPGAVEVVDARLIAQIPRALARIDRSPGFVAEIQQRVRTKLMVANTNGLPRISEYGARGSLAAFIRVTAIREALMEKRSVANRTIELSDELDIVVERDATFDLARREHRSEFQDALRSAIAKLDRNERAALRLSYIDNLSIDQIGRLFRVHRATAARWITRAQERVRTLTFAELQARLRLTDSEVESLLTDMMSVEALSSGMLQSQSAA